MEYNREIARQQDHYDRALIKAEDAKLRRTFTTDFKLNIHPSKEQLEDNVSSLVYYSLKGDQALIYPNMEKEDCFGYTDGIPDEYGQDEFGQHACSWRSTAGVSNSIEEEPKPKHDMFGNSEEEDRVDGYDLSLALNPMRRALEDFDKEQKKAWAEVSFKEESEIIKYHEKRATERRVAEQLVTHILLAGKIDWMESLILYEAINN